MQNITYVTGNYGKYISVKEKFEKYEINIEYMNIDIEEPLINDIKYISMEKAKEAYKHVNGPVFVIDSGFYIRSYPNNSNYPGAFVKRSGVANDVQKLLDDMKDVDDRFCYFLDCLTYYDGDEFYQFFGKTEGNLSYTQKGNNIRKAKSNLWYVFIPSGKEKTLAEMSDYEKNNIEKTSGDATIIFAKWLKENVFKSKKQKILVKE